VLVRGGVDNELGAQAAHKSRKVLLVAHGRDVYLKVKAVSVGAYQLLLYFIRVVFVNINYYQLLGVEACDLTAKLRANRAAAARDHNGLTCDIARKACVIDVYRLASEKLLGRDVAKLLDTACIVVVEIVKAGEHLYLTARALTEIKYARAVSVVSRGNSDEYQVDIMLFCKAHNVLVAALYGHSANGTALLAFIVVNSDDGQKVAILRYGYFVKQSGARRATADDHNSFAIGVVFCLACGFERAVEKADADHSHGNRKHIEGKECERYSRKKFTHYLW
jgi:hypothetical protein